MPEPSKPWERLPAANRSSSERSIRTIRTRYLIGVTGTVVLGVLAYFFWPWGNSHYSLEDRQIEEEWMAGREVVDALEFFASGGVFADRFVSETRDVDRQYVIPLVKRLHDEFRLNVLAIKLKSPPDTAMAIVAESPTDAAARNRVRAAILETDDAFPGFVSQDWSRRWVSLEFLDEDSIPAPTLQKLRESQRRME